MRVRLVLVLVMAAAAIWLGRAPMASANSCPNNANICGTEGRQIGSSSAPVVLGTNGANPSAVTVAWGDGQSESCSMYSYGGSGCWWEQAAEFGGTVVGFHTYAEQDAVCFPVFRARQRTRILRSCPIGSDLPYTYTITYTFPGGSSETETGTASVADASLTGYPQTGTALVGVSGQEAVAHFTDADPGGIPSDYTASINWGDSSATDTAVTIRYAPRSSDNGLPGFDVIGTHAYTSPGTYAVKVVAQDGDGVSSGPITINSTITASSSGVESLSPVEGAPFSGLVAQFCSPPQPVSSATVAWGDGSTSPSDGEAVTVTPVSGNCYQVSGSHTYRDEAPTPLTITVTPSPTSGGLPAPATGAATVADAALRVAFNSSALAGGALDIPSSVIAHVADANPDAPACGQGGSCDLSANIAWGDGSSSQGAISPDASGGFDVTGGHAYAAPGTYTIVARVADKGGATASAQGVYTIKPPPGVGQGCSNPVPAIGATQGLYGASLYDPSRFKPHWGLSPDDRVLRFGNLVLCSDQPWTYLGSTPQQRTCFFGCFQGGDFQTGGDVELNGILLEQKTSGPITVDTWNQSISGPPTRVMNASRVLGDADLSADPWTLYGSSLAYLQAGSDAYIGRLQLTGILHITIGGLGTSAIDAEALMPGIFSLQPYAGGQPTSPITIHAAYPGPGTAPHARIARPSRLHAGSDGCSYPVSSAPIQLTAPNLYLGGIGMQCAYLDYDPSTGDGVGGGGFGLGPVNVRGFLELQNNSFKGAGGSVDLNPGVPLDPIDAVSLQSISFDVLLDPTVLDAQAKLGLGAGAFSLDGGTLMAFATNNYPYNYNSDSSLTGHDDIPGIDSVLYGGPFRSFAVGAGGEFQPLGLPLYVKGYGLYVAPAYIEFGGSMSASVLSGAISLDANLQGQFWLNDHDFNIEGGINLCLPSPIGCNGISGILSSRGVIGCLNISYLIGSASVGGGYMWGAGGPSIYLGGCSDNFGSYRVSGAADLAQAGGARSFTLPRGLPGAMVRVTGGGGSPTFAIAGPHGERATAGADNAFSGTRQIIIMRMSRFATTWVGIKHPGGGRWTITPAPGSAPIAGVSIANGVPPASVHARVTGSGRRRSLHFTIRRRPGQLVQFVEIGRGASQSLGTTSGGHGVIRFAPAIGPAGRRQIVALVSMGAVPSKRIVVATYVAPGPPRAQRPPHLRLARRGSALEINWERGTDTTRYEIVVIASDGRRLLLAAPGRARSAFVAGFAASGALVKVFGVGPDGNLGPGAVARLSSLAAPARIQTLTISRHDKQVRVTWRAAARALIYRVTLRLSGVRMPVHLDTARHTVSFSVASIRTVVRVVVQGQGALGVLGPKATVELKARRK
jgi:hypothetical protein